MKFRLTKRFRQDFDDLDAKDQKAVEDAKKSIALALTGNVGMYNKHKIKEMEGRPRIWEGHVRINLCFTFHYDKTDSGEKVVFFRRVGTHKIYKNP